MMTDPIADMLTRIRNANSVGLKKVTMSASKMKVGIAQVLKDEGFINDYSVVEEKPASRLVVNLKFGPDGEKVIREITRISKPGCRRFSGSKELPPVLRGLGIYVLSTPMGIVSDRSARKENVGGEILCKVS